MNFLCSPANARRWGDGLPAFAKRVCAFLLVCALSNASAAPVAKTDAQDAVIDEIARTGIVKIGYLADNSPFSFPKGGSVTGFSIDLCSKVTEQIRKSLKLKQLATKYIEVQSDERIPKLKSHQIHMECGASTNTIQRQRDVAFSYTMFVSSVRMMSRTAENIVDYRDLAGKRIAVLNASTAQQAVTLRLKTIDVRAQIIEVQSDSAAVALLENHKADVYVNDEVFLFALRSGMKEPGSWAITGRPLTVEPYAIMLPKDAPQLMSLVDETMGALFRSGEFASIYDHWFTSSDMHMPIGQMLKESIKYPNKSGMPEAW